MIRHLFRAVLIVAAMAVVMRLSPKAVWPSAAPDGANVAAAEAPLPEEAPDNGAAATGAAAAEEPQPSEKPVKPARDRFARAVLAAFALPKGITYSRLSTPQQKKWDDLHKQLEPKLREALQAVQDNNGDKETEAKHDLAGVRKEIRDGIDQLLSSSGGGQETPSSSGSRPSASTSPPSYPPPGNYNPAYPGYVPYSNGGYNYYPGYGYGSPNYRRPTVSQTNPPATTTTTTSHPAKPATKPTPKPPPPPPKPTPKPTPKTTTK
jgi:hypothetical protein